MGVKHNVPIQSLIDHIKTAIDVDPWAKEMAEELLKEQEPERVEIVDSDSGRTHWYVCGRCKVPINPGDLFCHECGRAVKWDD